MNSQHLSPTEDMDQSEHGTDGLCQSATRRAICTMDCGDIRHGLELALQESDSALKIELQKTKKLQGKLECVKSEYQGHLLTLEEKLAQLQAELIDKKDVIIALRKTSKEQGKVFETTIKQYESRVAELDKAIVLFEIREQRSPLPGLDPNTNIGDVPDKDSNCSCHLQVPCLTAENQELNEIINDLHSELEVLRADRMERMECSISSPARKSLGTVLEGLGFDQDLLGSDLVIGITDDQGILQQANRQKNPTRITEPHFTHPDFHYNHSRTRSVLSTPVATISQLNDVTLGTEVESLVADQGTLTPATRAGMRLGALVLGSIVLVPKISSFVSSA